MHDLKHISKNQPACANDKNVPRKTASTKILKGRAQKLHYENLLMLMLLNLTLAIDSRLLSTIKFLRKVTLKKKQISKEIF